MTQRKKGNSGKVRLALLVTLCAALLLSVPQSLARYHRRVEYPLKLAMAVHAAFAAGKRHDFEIPYDGYYAVQLWGGSGGDGKNVWNNGSLLYPLGGSGGEVSAMAWFRKGELLVITVGTKGGTTAGGFGGGGAGGTDLAPIFNDYFGGGGGGATDVRLASDLPSARILVAGGGGGASGGSVTDWGGGYAPAKGGDGGSAQSGLAGGNGIGGAKGGTLTGGGDGHQNGSLENGGGGNYSGGGGGGGYYGGGGGYGSGGGGGGGSSYIAPHFTHPVPQGLPGRSEYPGNAQDGFALVSFFGDVLPE